MNDDMYMAYAKHEQEKEMVVQMIVNQIAAGADINPLVLQIQLDDDFSEGDWDYIEEEVCRRIKDDVF